MNWLFTIPGALLVSCALLTGCSGGSGRAKLLTGVFIDGPVEGLSYETATLSGLTDAGGVFFYREGEIVAFSIGGIKLGSAPGAVQISPFDLFGLEPPSTELELRQELGTPDEITDLDRVANIAMLLMALDNDGNPDNGLDLSGWQAVLADAELDFNQSWLAFSGKFRRFAATHGVSRLVLPEQPLSHLYESLGIVVPVHLRTAESTIWDNDDSSVAARDFEYDQAGRMVISTYDRLGDGIYEHITSYTYRSDGRIDTVRNEQDYDSDEIVESVTEFVLSYNANGSPATNTYEIDDGVDTVIDTRGVTTLAYDEFGERVSLTEEMDNNPVDGSIDTMRTITYTYDDDGNLLTTVEENDTDASGTPDTILNQTYTYDARGNQLTELNEMFELPFGDEVLIYRDSHIRTFDDQNRLLTEESERDHNGDNIVDAYRMLTYTYNNNGNPIGRTYSLGNDGNDIDSTMESTYYYDDNRNLITLVEERHAGVSDIIYERTTSTYTYDSHGNLLSELQQRDFDPLDSVDLVDQEVFTEYEYMELSDGLHGLLFEYRNPGLL